MTLVITSESLNPLPLVELVDDFFTVRAPRKESAHTIAAYRRDLAGLLDVLGHQQRVSTVDLTSSDISARTLRQAFAAFAETRAASSVARAWSTWNQFCGFLVSEGVLDGNPMAAVSRPRLTEQAPKPLQGERTPEQLLEAVASGARRARNPWPERDLAVIAVALLTGLRSAELLSLTLGSLSGRPGERRLAVRGKGGKDRSVPIEESLYELVMAYFRSREVRFPYHRYTPEQPLFVDTKGDPLARGGLQYLVRQSFRHAGLGDRVQRGTLLHAFRHTFATRLAEDGATSHELMRLLGHASVASSQHYVDATSREQRFAARSNRTYAVVQRLVDNGDD